MRIEYFCFSVPSLGSTDFAINENDGENVRWIKTEEEKFYLRALKEDKVIVFNRTTKKFYKNDKEFDVTGKKIFPRAFLPYINELLEHLENAKADSIQTRGNFQTTTHWPLLLQPKHRPVIETTYQEFKDNHEKYQVMLKNTFFKTAEKSSNRMVLKWYGNLTFGSMKLFATKPPIFDVSADDKIFLSEVYEPIIDKENDDHRKEYRAFVVDGELLSISRSYIDYPTETPQKVVDFANEVIEMTNARKEFPKSYVVDLAEMIVDGKEVVDIIEFNPLCSSGLEVNNDLLK